eukprot:1137094-Pelagomonas_calceolata.AAC.3
MPPTRSVGFLYHPSRSDKARASKYIVIMSDSAVSWCSLSGTKSFKDANLKSDLAQLAITAGYLEFFKVPHALGGAIQPNDAGKNREFNWYSIPYLVPKVPRRLSGAIRFIDANRAHIHPLLDTACLVINELHESVDHCPCYTVSSEWGLVEMRMRHA